MNGFAPTIPTKSISVKKIKGLPKRATQAQHKTRRQACWTRGEQRKGERRLAQAERQRNNDLLRRGRTASLPGVQIRAMSAAWLTPWELSKHARRIKRAKLQNKAVVTVTPKAEES